MLYEVITVAAFRGGIPERICRQAGGAAAGRSALQQWIFCLLAAGVITSYSIHYTKLYEGLLPTKGLTLPLMSYGGSSMVIMCAAVALLLRVDHETRCTAAGLSASGSAAAKRRRRDA